MSIRSYSIQRFKLLNFIKEEFRSYKGMAKSVDAILEKITIVIHNVHGTALFMGKRKGTKIRYNIFIASQLGLSQQEHTNQLMQIQQHLRDGSTTTVSIQNFGIRRSKISCITFFPIIVHERIVGMFAVGHRRNAIGSVTIAFLQIIANNLSLEFEDRLLKKKLDEFSEELSFVEYSHERIVESLPVGVIALDRDYNVTLANVTMQKILGKDDVITKYYPSLFENEHVEKILKNFIGDLERYNLLTNIDKLIYKSRGIPKVLEIVGYPLFDMHGKVVSYVIIHEDITRRYTLSQKLKETQQKTQEELEKKVHIATREIVAANKELLRLNKVKSEFVSTISHELKTPLTSIKGYVALLHSGKLGKIDKTQKDALGIIAQESDRLAALINDVLDLSRLESGKTTLKLAKIPLGKIIKEAITILTPQIKEKNIEVQFAPKHAAKEEISIDGDKIKQAVINLLSNAIKFTPEGGRIIISVSHTAQMMNIEVEDTGIGISEEDQKQLFNPFYQVEDHMTRNVGGSGLGLAITKHIVEMHKGSIDIISKEHKGSTFTIKIPKNLEVELKGN